MCICYAIEQLKCAQKIVVLQHPNEANHAKNSARLIPLCLNNVRIVVGESSDDFSELVQACKSKPEEFAVFYPSEFSEAFEDNILQFKQQRPDTLIFIDATWRKAYKMWQLNSWLHQLSSWHFVKPPSSRYDVRFTSVKNGLSTLEAVAYTLEAALDLDCSPLYRCFSAMQTTVFNAKKTVDM